MKIVIINPREKEYIVTVEKLVASGLRGGAGALAPTGQVRPGSRM